MTISEYFSRRGSVYCNVFLDLQGARPGSFKVGNRLEVISTIR